MEYIGNFADWIDPAFIDYILNNEGKHWPDQFPKAIKRSFANKSPTYYPYTESLCQMYIKNEVPFKFKPPIELQGRFYWWAIKMYPGNMLPMHHDYDDVPSERLDTATNYWMPLQDYTDGHIFVFNNVLMKDYKKGDLFKHGFKEIHGICNIGFTPRLSLNFTDFPFWPGEEEETDDD